MLNDTHSKYYAPPEHVAVDKIVLFFKENINFKQYISNTDLYITFKQYISNTDLQIMKLSAYTYDVDIY
jgi:hypothetical protein